MASAPPCRSPYHFRGFCPVSTSSARNAIVLFYLLRDRRIYSQFRFGLHTTKQQSSPNIPLRPATAWRRFGEETQAPNPLP